jgi:hypothetical protein
MAARHCLLRTSLALPLQPAVPNPSPLPMLVLGPQISCPQVQVLGIRFTNLKRRSSLHFLSKIRVLQTYLNRLQM